MEKGLRGHRQGKLKIVGIGPGERGLLGPKAHEAIRNSQIVVGYKAYIRLVDGLLEGALGKEKEIISSGMTQERSRAKLALEKALEGHEVCLISSGDPGIYGMAGPVLELLNEEEAKRIDIEIIPGITAASACASLLGAPLMNDFAVISLSDLLTDRQRIEERVESACKGDFVMVFYNPKSKTRIEPLKRAWEILMRHRPPETPVGIVRNAHREAEEVILTSLKELLSIKRMDMGTTIIVGNSSTYFKGNYMITPRGYSHKE